MIIFFDSFSFHAEVIYKSINPVLMWDSGDIGPKIKYFLFPLTRPTLKKWPYPKIFFFSWKFWKLNIFFIHQNLYILIRGLFFMTLFFFPYNYVAKF